MPVAFAFEWFCVGESCPENEGFGKHERLSAVRGAGDEHVRVHFTIFSTLYDF